MADLVLKQEEVQQLDELIQNIPTKYGFKLIIFLNNVAAKRKNEKLAEEQFTKEQPAKSESLPTDIKD